MMRKTPPFRADHVGSILRSAPLKDAREKFFAAKLDAAGLKAVEDTEIRKIIAKQEEIRRWQMQQGPCWLLPLLRAKSAGWPITNRYSLPTLAQSLSPMTGCHGSYKVQKISPNYLPTAAMHQEQDISIPSLRRIAEIY